MRMSGRSLWTSVSQVGAPDYKSLYLRCDRVIKDDIQYHHETKQYSEDLSDDEDSAHNAQLVISLC